MKILKAFPLCMAVAGCTPIPQYTVPASEPKALIKSEMAIPINRRNWIEILVASPDDAPSGAVRKGKSSTLLFTVTNRGVTPEGFREIAAGKLLHMTHLGGLSAQRSCNFPFSATFEPGAHYVLSGGYEEVGYGTACRISIVNLDTGITLPLTDRPSTPPFAKSLEGNR